MPLTLATALAYVLRTPQPGRDSIAILGVVVGLTFVLVTLAVRSAHMILRRAEQLERWRSEMEQTNDVARESSLRDGLTGLGNYRAFHEELDRELDLYQRHRVPVALLLIDVDDLKLANESEGHATGDGLLRDLGRLISEMVRYTDRAFRIGGDEFAILMPHTDAEGATHVARRLLERALRPLGGARPIPFSGGISACPQLATNRTQLYAQADAALAWCKHHGRASVDVFHPMRDRAVEQDWTNDPSVQLANVVANRLIRPVYQPIVDLTSGRVLGFEGLSRPSSESGFADPGSMFAAAETVGRTVELDLACLHTVVAGARLMPPHQLLTINISPRTIEAPHFTTEALLAIIARHGIAPERVVVELTERERVEDLNRLRTALAALQRAGLRIAADDVGAGNAGLRLLSQFRFDIVKIDLSLVQGGAERDSSRAVLRSLLDLAGRWSASVIAEGLETAGQLRMVRELGMTAGQGYLLARPMPQATMTEIDLNTLEAGGSILERRPQPAPQSSAQPTRTEVASPFNA